MFEHHSKLYFLLKLLEYCGNIYDACVLACKFALNQSKLPALIIKSDDEGQIELDFSDNPSDLMVMRTDEVPYAVTVNKIGQHYVIDSNLKEESVTKVRTTLGFDSQGNIRFANKDGFGSLDPETLYSIIEVGFLFKVILTAKLTVIFFTNIWKLGCQGCL